MSLDYIYLCCDDGEVYKTDFVEGDDWCISLEEEQDDELWIAARPRERGEPRHIPRAKVDPLKIAAQYGLPIQGVRPSGNRRDWKGREWAVFRITWKPGVPFPRKLLPDTCVPKQRRNLSTGIYCCATKEHLPW